MIDLGGVTFHLYGLLIGIGVWLALEIAIATQKTDRAKRLVEASFPWVLIGGIIGARAYHVIDYWGRYYSSNPIKIFYFWEGGLGIWGAIIGGILAAYVYTRIKKEKFISLTDSLVVGVPLAQAVGRLGNWVNGELVGKNGEPLFAYEAALNTLLFFVLWRVAKNKTRSGHLTGIYLVGYGLIRIILEDLRPNEIIWKYAGIPVAIIFGVVAVATGLAIIFRRRS